MVETIDPWVRLFLTVNDRTERGRPRPQQLNHGKRDKTFTGISHCHDRPLTKLHFVTARKTPAKDPFGTLLIFREAYCWSWRCSPSP